jgi:hypothetical protein
MARRDRCAGPHAVLTNPPQRRGGLRSLPTLGMSRPRYERVSETWRLRGGPSMGGWARSQATARAGRAGCPHDGGAPEGSPGRKGGGGCPQKPQAPRGRGSPKRQGAGEAPSAKGHRRRQGKSQAPRRGGTTGEAPGPTKRQDLGTCGAPGARHLPPSSTRNGEPRAHQSGLKPSGPIPFWLHRSYPPPQYLGRDGSTSSTHARYPPRRFHTRSNPRVRRTSTTRALRTPTWQ